MDCSPHAVPEAELQRWFRLYRERYLGYNVRHFYARVRRQGSCRWSYTVMRRALQAAGLVKKQRTRGRHFVRREPRACFGELLHIDGSRHRWLTLRPDQWQSLFVVVDDATRRVLYARLVDHEDSHAIFTALAAVVRRHGIPQALLGRLGVEQILTYSPQARGRSECVNSTLQDRLVKELQTAGIRTLERANCYLEECFLPAYNDEFARLPADPQSGFAPPDGADLETICCQEESRIVQRDNTVTLEGVRLQIAKQPRRTSCAGLSVAVRRHLDGTHTVWWGPKLLGRYGTQGRALSREPLVHRATSATPHVAA